MKQRKSPPDPFIEFYSFNFDLLLLKIRRVFVFRNRPLSRDVTHDELRIGRHVGGKTKKEQKKFLKKIPE